MGMFVRLADDFGGAVSPFQKSFFRNLVAVFVAGALFALKWREAARAPLPRGEAAFRGSGTPAASSFRGSGTPAASPWGPLVWRSILGTVGIFGNFYALSHIPLGDACMLNKLSPFSAVACAWLFLGERVRMRQGLAIAGAFIGAMFVVKPGFAFASGSTWPALAGLVGGVAAGGAYACIRHLGRLGVEPSFIVLFFSAFSTLASLPFMIFGYQPMTSAQVAILLGAGISATVGQFGITAAYRLARPRELAVYDYANVAFAAVLGFLVFGQVPDAFSWLGIAMIVAMGVWMNRVAD